MGSRVRRIKTEVSAPQMAQAIFSGWQQLFGKAPTREQVSIVLAQNALETGHRKSMWNFNIGNITTDGKGRYDFYDDLETAEQIHPGVWKKMNLKYKSYPSLSEGVKDYLRLISGKRYINAWKYIENPNPIAFSKALKNAGYYTANEAPYTKTITKLYNQFVKSDIYDKVKTVSKIPANNQSLTNILNNYLQMVASTEKNNKKLYKENLPNNNLVIKIISSNYTNSIEFSRILCSALEEELMAKAYTHTNGKNTEIECSILGPKQDCIKTVQQLSNSLSSAFKNATYKIGEINIKTECIINKKSSYKQISFKSADSQYKQFLLKFI